MTTNNGSGEDGLREADDLIMRLKDCISHEHLPNQAFNDRCITKVQFKQQMRAIIQSEKDKLLKELLEKLPKDKQDSYSPYDPVTHLSYDLESDGWNRALTQAKQVIQRMITASEDNKKGK